MQASHSLFEVSSLMADPTRAEMLMAMMGGEARPAGELAALAHVSPATASHHLALLIDGGLVEVLQVGRHRYHRLAGPDIAELLEGIAAFQPKQIPPPSRATKLTCARICYDHLAGNLGVQLRKTLEAKGHIVEDSSSYRLTPSGQEFFAEFGIDTNALTHQKRPLGRACIDWTERVFHLGGSLGAALLTRFIERRWVQRVEGTREITVTSIGQECLYDLFGIETPPRFGREPVLD
jgi:DNA-binding transcriptional ArsR family regulator